MYVKIKLSFIIFILIVSCSKENGTKEYTHFVKEIKTININIPNDTYYMSWNNQVVENNGKIELLRLRYKQENGQGINHYDLVKKKFIKAEIYPSEGNNGVGDLLGFYYINQDSIILINQTKLSLVNREKQIVNSIKLVNNYKHSYFPISVSNKTPIAYSKGEIYIEKQEYSYHYSNDFYASKLNLAIDLTNNHIKEKQNISFPEKYFDKCWGYSNSTSYRTYNPKENLFIYSFPIDDNLYVFDPKKDKIIKIISCKSKFIEEIKPMSCNHKNDTQRRKKYYLTTSNYDNIIFDKHNDIYYRFIKLSITEEKIPEVLNSRVGNLAKSLVIMVLDKDFNIIGETKMADNRFYTSDHFVTSEGLWISNNHPENPNFNENILSFSLFNVNLKKNENEL